MLGWKKHKLESIAGRNINNLRYADDTTLMAESKELKSFLMKVKEENEKALPLWVRAALRRQKPEGGQAEEHRTSGA